MAVFPVRLSPPVRMTLVHATTVFDFGDGFEQRVNKNLAYTHADGQGGVTSHKGRWRFSITMESIKQANADANQEVNKLLSFAIARLGAYESFYFYNPVENDVDLTGTETTGRYLVRFASDVTIENFIYKLYRGTLDLIEVRA